MTARVSLLARIAEVLLFISDKLSMKKTVSSKICRETTSTWLPLPEGEARKGTLMPGGGYAPVVLTGYEGEHLSIEQVAARREDALFTAELCTNEALSLLAKLHERDIVEPVTMAPLLELRAAVYERQNGRGVEAIEAANRAVVVSERAIGRTDERTLRLITNALRLLTRYASKEGYKQATIMATDLSRRLDELSARDLKAADRLARDCSRLLSIVKLLEKGEITVDVIDQGGLLENRISSIEGGGLIQEKISTLRSRSMVGIKDGSILLDIGQQSSAELNIKLGSISMNDLAGPGGGLEEDSWKMDMKAMNVVGRLSPIKTKLPGIRK